jgi:hypothetical protein
MTEEIKRIEIRFNPKTEKDFIDYLDSLEGGYAPNIKFAIRQMMVSENQPSKKKVQQPKRNDPTVKDLFDKGGIKPVSSRDFEK